MIDKLDDAGNFIDKSNCTSDMIEDGDLPDLLLWVRNDFEQLRHGVRVVDANGGWN